MSKFPIANLIKPGLPIEMMEGGFGAKMVDHWAVAQTLARHKERMTV